MEPELEIGNINNTRAASLLLINIALELVEALNAVHPKDKRVIILQLSTLRAVRLAQAALLLDEHDFVEEVLSLSRTLAEMVISCCYLQIASPEKVESFLAFDSQKSYHMSATLEEFLGPEAIISEEERDKLKTIVASARARSKRKDTDNTWNTESVYQMAQALDTTMVAGSHLFTFVKATTYQFGHPYVHGTWGSFSAVRRWMAEGTFPGDSRRAEQRFQAAAGVYQCLAALCVYINEHFKLQFQQRIVESKFLNEKGSFGDGPE
jgi:Family of unknown function (DUF5677)